MMASVWEGTKVTVTSAVCQEGPLDAARGGRGFALPEPRRKFSDSASSFGFAQPSAAP